MTFCSEHRRMRSSPLVEPVRLPRSSATLGGNLGVLPTSRASPATDRLRWRRGSAMSRVPRTGGAASLEETIAGGSAARVDGSAPPTGTPGAGLANEISAGADMSKLLVEV